MTDDAAPEATPSAGRFAGRRVLALGTFDSFVRTAAIVGGLFEAEGAEMKVAALAAADGQLSARQRAAGGIDADAPVLGAKALVDARLFRDAHVVIAVIDGGRARELFLALAAADLSREPARPIVVVASPGVALSGQVEGFLARAPADVIGFNTPAEKALYEAAAAEIGLDATNAVVTGLLGLDRKPRATPEGRPAIVFFEQPVMPARRLQREHLLAGLVALAERVPDCDVLVKLRHRREEKAHHSARYHFEDLADGLLDSPPNFAFTHEPAHELLDRATLAATVSSTVAVEAMARGVPTRIISDFGVSEALGTTYFIGSGCFAPLAALRPDLPAAVDPDWLARSGAAADPEALLAQCAALLGGQDRLEAALPLRPLAPAYGSPEWLAYAIERGGEAAIHAPHLLEKSPRGRGVVAAVARRLKRTRTAPGD